MSIMLNMRRIIIALIMISILSGCGAKPYPYSSKNKLTYTQRQRLTAVANHYTGAPYKYGGNTRSGFDCSGLVYRVYHDALGIKLPRTVNKLYKNSYEIPLSKAKPGDLVFFIMRNRGVDHVGLMIDQSRFIQASKSRGVVITWLGKDYYWKRFAGIRRLW